MINQELVNKIHCLLDKGVTPGFSKDPKPGNMCLEQAVSYALEEEITGHPSCVGEEVRAFVTCLNDVRWSSPSARAEGMRDLAIAHLGSNSLDQNEFIDKLVFAVITKMLPAMFRDLGEERWKKEIKSLEGAKDLEEAIKAAYDAADAACYVALSAACAASYAVFATYAVNAVCYAADATNTGDKYRSMVAHLVVEVLKDMKSPGCQFL